MEQIHQHGLATAHVAKEVQPTGQVLWNIAYGRFAFGAAAKER